MPFLRSNGIKLHYNLKTAGDSPLLVFINSLGTDLRIWDGMSPHLEAVASLLKFDKRGHGRSECPPGPYTIRDHTLDLAGLLQSLEIGSAVLVGISVGGMIAMDYACLYPDRVSALVLADTAATIATPGFWNERIKALRARGLEAMGESIIDRWFTPGYGIQNRQVRKYFFNMLTRMPLEGYIATCQAIRDADLRQSASQIDVKTLVLCGELDRATPVDQVRRLSQSLKRSSFEIIGKAAHLPCVEQPARTAALIRRFIERKENV